MIFGVAGGMAEWLDLDPAVVRLVWALLIIAGGVGLLLYIVAAIVVPEEPFEMAGAAPGAADPGTDAGAAAGAPDSHQARWEARQARRAARRQGGGNGAFVVGIVLVFLGAWFLIQRYLPSFDSSFIFPGALIVIGVALVIGAMGRSRT